MAREADHDSPILRARERVEALATEDGAFVVAGKETGVSPPPVSRARFGSYDDAERARSSPLFSPIPRPAAIRSSRRTAPSRPRASPRRPR